MAKATFWVQQLPRQIVPRTVSRSALSSKSAVLAVWRGSRTPNCRLVNQTAENSFTAPQRASRDDPQPCARRSRHTGWICKVYQPASVKSTKVATRPSIWTFGHIDRSKLLQRQLPERGGLARLFESICSNHFQTPPISLGSALPKVKSLYLILLLKIALKGRFVSSKIPIQSD